MAVNKNTNIANGIISAIVLACGIVLSILVGLLIRKIVEMATVGLSSSGFDSTSYAAYAGSPYWSIGFAFIVPGLIGVIASLVRQKCGFVLQMVFTIITLVVMGIFFIIGLIALSALSVYGYTSCTEVLGNCVCNNGYSASVNVGTGCSDMNAIASMGIGATAMMVIGWLAALAASITGGMLACAREDTPGVIIHQTHQPGVTVMHMGNMPAGQPYVIQPGYGAQPNPYVVSPGSTSPPSYGGHSGYGAQSNYAPSSGYPESGYEHLSYKK